MNSIFSYITLPYVDKILYYKLLQVTKINIYTVNGITNIFMEIQYNNIIDFTKKCTLNNINHELCTYHFSKITNNNLKIIPNLKKL